MPEVLIIQWAVTPVGYLIGYCIYDHTGGPAASAWVVLKRAEDDEVVDGAYRAARRGLTITTCERTYEFAD